MSAKFRFYGQETKAQFHRHHLIPVAVFTSKYFADDFDRIKRLSGFDTTDFQTNGIYLPCTEQAAVEFNRPLHRGPHPQYSALVADRVAAIINSKIHAQTDAERLRRRLRNLQKSLFRSLSRANRSDRDQSIGITRRDPMAHGVDFRRVDADISMLWADTAPESLDDCMR